MEFPRRMELSEKEELYVEKTSLVLFKDKTTTRFAFDNFTYIACMKKMEHLLPFMLNPTPRQYDLLIKFQAEISKHGLEEEDFAYPCLTPNMAAVMKEVCEATDFCRTEMFLQKHYLGVNLSTLEVFSKIGKISGSL